jgi:hypothetical protein
MDSPNTVTEAVALLEAEGYSTEFSLTDDGVHCDACGRRHDPARVTIRRRFRFEGPSDPGDEAIVLGLECPECGAKGILVSAYGPDADDGLLALLDRLPD